LYAFSDTGVCFTCILFLSIAQQVVFFSFFKNFLYPLPLFWFAFYSQFSGQSLYDSLIITNFNMFFSSLPPLIAGVVEKDVVESSLLRHPVAYKKFRKSPSFTLPIFLTWPALGTYQSLSKWQFCDFCFRDLPRSLTSPS
jgi:magnesium-transporting ATPase (P-type)